MKRTLFSAVVMATSAWASATYTFSSTNYGSITNYTSCASGPCANYTSSMNVTGSFTLAAALPPNFSGGADISSQVSSYSFSDGVNTYTNTDPNARIYQFSVVTDATGQITIASLLLERWQSGSSPHSVGDRVTTLNLNGPTINQAQNNLRCTTAGGGTSSGVTDLCVFASPDGSSSLASASAGTWSGGGSSTPPSTPSAVPLPPTAIFGITGLLGVGLYQARRKLLR